MVERVFQFVDAEPAVAQQLEHHARIERAGTSTHHQALERRHAHRRPYRPPAIDRANGAAAAEVGHDQAKASRISTQKLTGALHRPLNRQPVEAVPSDTPLLVPLIRQRVDVASRRQRSVKRCVKGRYVRDIGQGFASSADRVHGHRVVQRCQLGELVQLR